MIIKNKVVELITEGRAILTNYTLDDAHKTRLKEITSELDDIMITYKYYCWKIASRRLEQGEKLPTDRYFPERLLTPIDETFTMNGISLFWGDHVCNISFEDLEEYLKGN